MNLARRVVLFSLRLYKLLISPALHFIAGPFGGCRYTPTCSEYAAEAVALHGVLRGTVLAVKRICRCYPWGGCGHDPVPRRLTRSFTFRWWRMRAPACCGHVDTQHATHFGCPPPAH